MTRLVGTLALALLCACAASSPEPPHFDAVSADPPVDAAQPAKLAEDVSFTSGGARMNAILYEAAGAGPHPTAILLHGFPGNERNLDLAQSLRRAGWNAVFFHYRGTWGSRGDFSFANVLEDAAAVLAQVREPAFAQAHRIDPDRIALIGHSMGGFAALITASEHDEVECAISLAGANFGVLAVTLTDGTAAESARQRFELWGTGPIPGISGEALIADLREHAAAYDLTKRAPALATKPVLLVAGSRDTVARPEIHHAPLATAIAAQPGAQLSQLVLDSDHAFSDSRVALAHGVLDFLAQECAAPPG